MAAAAGEPAAGEAGDAEGAAAAAAAAAAKKQLARQMAPVPASPSLLCCRSPSISIPSILTAPTPARPFVSVQELDTESNVVYVGSLAWNVDEDALNVRRNHNQSDPFRCLL